MSGYVYLIRNGDLHKIGITRNVKQRMGRLRPDSIVSIIKTENFESLEKELHRRYKHVRIPQTEYFRLNASQLRECKKILKGIRQYKSNFTPTFKADVISLVGIFLLGQLTYSLIRFLSKDTGLTPETFLESFPLSTLFTGWYAFGLSIRTFCRWSGKRLSIFDEIRDRCKRSFILIMIAMNLFVLAWTLSFLVRSPFY